MGRVILAALLVAACAGGSSGLGRKACPYLRPRVLRLDAALTAGNTLVLVALDQDIGQYIKTNLPDGGKDKGDQPVVALSAALHVSPPLPSLAAAERAIKHECAMAGG